MLSTDTNTATSSPLEQKNTKPSTVEPFRQINGSAKKPKESTQESAEQKTKKPPAGRICDEFLADSKKKGRTYVFWRGAYYCHTGKYYRECQYGQVEMDIAGFMKYHLGASEHFTTSYLSAVEKLVCSSVKIEDSIEEGSFISGRLKGEFLSVDNGILSLDKFIKGESDPLQSHTEDFFSVTCLPFPYVSGAVSQPLQKFLDTSLANQKEIHLFLQEWFGLNLCQRTCEILVILQGEGANGKSVCGTILKTLMGSGNFSAVAPEDLSNDDKLLSLVGMRANICDDMNENIPLKFGTIKSVVSGSEITVRRKYKTSLTFSPRAKHTWICNHYPNITDRSEGTLRRLVPLNFDIQIPEDQRRPEFKEPSWWIEKGNMSGVLNWALEGMKRLSQNDWKFNIPEASKEIKETIRVDSQPELQFFDQHLQFGTGPTFIVSVSQLYEAYMLWMKGQKNALKQINLTKAFKRRYPQIEHREKTTNPLWSGEQRYFVGVRLINQPKSNSYPGLHQNAVNGYQPTVPDSRVDETVEKLASVEKQVKKQSNIQSDMGNAIEGMMKVIVRMLNQYNIPLNIDEFRNEVLKEMGPPSGIDEYTIQS